ncbi:MAG: magnesium transporter [Armatimonadetes bacterium]|nr:magnesium transporter [Armatimonadota bacterium]
MITDPLVQETTTALEQRTVARLHALIEDLHPADLAELVRRLAPPHRLAFMLLLDEERAAAVLEALEPEEQTALVRTLTDEQVSGLLGEMATDEVVDLLGELPAARVQRLLRLMGAEEASRIRELLQFPDGSAGALMTTDLVTISAGLSAVEAIADVRRRGQDAELLYYVYVTEAARLTGVLSLRALIVAPPEAPVREIMQTTLVTANPWADRDEVARLIEKYDLLALPVVDAAGRLLGIVTADDILEVVQEEASEDVFALTAPVAEATLAPGPFPWGAAWRRTFWMIVNFGTALLAAAVIGAFTPVIETFLVLVFFMPVVMATAGNVGTQSLAVAVRRFALEKRWQPQVRGALRRELAVGLWLGMACGTLLAAVVLVWYRDPRLGAVLWLAMVAALAVAAAGGVAIPLALQRLRIDPAVASGPLVTTITDLASASIYFTLALLLMGAGP